MKDVTKLLAAAACSLLLCSPALADDSKMSDEDEGFFDTLADDAGDFFGDVGDFFVEDIPEFVTEDVPEFVTEDVPSVFSGDSEDGNTEFNEPRRILADKGSIKKTQALLNRKGFSAGPADGVIGRKTRTAIVQYEKKHGMKVSGQVTNHLLMHLRSGEPKSPSVAKARDKSE